MAKANRFTGATRVDRTATPAGIPERADQPPPHVFRDQDVELTGRGRLTVGGLEVEPRVVHDWSRDGWGPWRSQLISEDLPAGILSAQGLSVVDGRGRITGHSSTSDGNFRAAYEREGTEWPNSEVLCLWYGSRKFGTTGDNPSTAQAGQFHRGYIDSTGRWRGVVVSNNIFLTDVNVLNQNVWNHDPTQSEQDALDLGSNGASKTYNSQVLSRALRVDAVARVVFGSTLNQYRCTPRHLYDIDTAVAVTVDVTDATYDVSTATLITSADLLGGTVAVVDAEAGAPESEKFNGGTITPDTDTARRYWPYWVRSQLVDQVLRVKAWRYMDTEPDWSNTAHVATVDFAGAATPEPAARMPEGAGRCGLVGAHLRSSRYLEYGHFEARRLP